MPTQYILLKPSDGALFRLARAVCRQPTCAPVDFAKLAKRLCAKEAGKAEVNVAQMTEILADLRELLAADLQGVLEVLGGKIAER
jgi:hypothetical protein